ncbi:MAG: hypothetical protein KBG20_09785 [Caldilineaceae bacterium]|nr:hypothetical protein [Caldilineaceae bacterium]MBP8107117.1 hypothetical protein [Caldilineaceae bacterium]MBP8123617.1 hypothetical protein [Caldilineaceae bacterium]MBP9072580.1 hypothetical protein [Caldilineaceae bacterium]
MIVLDEQLLGRGLEVAIGKWYRGSIVYVTDLRPDTVIKDDAIPMLLRHQRQPTFVTINVSDFWRKTPADSKYAIVSIAIPNSKIDLIPSIVRRLFGKPQFSTKERRCGQVVLVRGDRIWSYTEKSSNGPINL